MLPKLSRLKIAGRGRRLVLLGLLAASGVGTGYVAIDRSEGGIGGAKAAMMAALADPLSLFTDRSPGGREPGALTQTKGPRERTLTQTRERPHTTPKAAAPVEHVLASVRERPPFVDEGAIPYGQPEGPITPDILPPENPGPFSPGPSPFIPPITGYGSGGPPVTPPVTPPGGGGVPEPATWAMLMIGFFSIGTALRRRQRLAAVANR